MKNLVAASFFAALTSCAAIPIMVPDMAMHPPNSVSLDGANGPLTAKQSQEILAKIKKNSDETNIFDKHLALESEIVGSPLVVGNKVDLLIDGNSTYDAMLQDINNAKDHINMETYIFENDEVGKHFSDILISKQLSGVQVNIVYDSVGSMNTPKAFFIPLIQSGANVLEFNPINPLNSRKNWRVSQRDHRKLLIIDGAVAYVGGINISSVYSSGSFGKSDTNNNKKAWRDTQIRIDGPVVSEFQKLFIATWNKQIGEPLASKNYFPKITKQGHEVVRAIGSSPDEKYSHIYSTLISAINSAETRIVITNAYFVPDSQLLDALKEATKRGVDVSLLLPAKTDSALVFHASRSYYDELLSADIKIYERQEVLLHAKTALIDGVWSTIGSTNLDWRSFINNQEINAVILGQDFGTKMQEMFDQDLKFSKLITLKEWRKRSLLLRIKENAARLWARWL